MHRSLVTLAMPWLIGLGLVLIAAVIARGFWLYRASLTWPTADGVITRIDIERKSSGGSPSGHYFSATFAYDPRYGWAPGHWHLVQGFFDRSGSPSLCRSGTAHRQKSCR